MGEIRRIWLSNRAVDKWNGLSDHIVSGEAMGNFTRRLHKFMDDDDDDDDKWS